MSNTIAGLWQTPSSSFRWAMPNPKLECLAEAGLNPALAPTLQTQSDPRWQASFLRPLMQTVLLLRFDLGPILNDRERSRRNFGSMLGLGLGVCWTVFGDDGPPGLCCA